MRKVKIGSRKHTRITVVDRPGNGGACHEYKIEDSQFQGGLPFATIKFQKGPIKEAGVNGCHQEDLIAIVIDRLQSFQAGDFACRENAIAITKLEECMMWLNKRTAERVARGVEGTNVR